ncbi:MAG TPA: TolC family protein [Terriglobales bacterium]|nr:TolC family protein [Terriglobales bacterium]
MATLNSRVRNGAKTKIVLMILTLSLAVSASAQTASNQVLVGSGNQQNTSSAPLTLTLQDALERAKKNNPEYRAAVTNFGLAKEDRVQSRAALLPSVNYNAAFLYTEGNGTAAARFIANNGVHEYISQGNVHQEFSLANIADYRRSSAAEAVARARSEIAARGLVVTVVQTYYGFVVAQRKYSTEQQATTEAQRFLDISQKLEHGGEVAHSDVIKAQIQTNQQQRDLQEAELEMNRSRLELAVLVFPDFNENFSVVDDLQMPQAVAAFPEVQAAAANKNPELRAALAALQQANQEVKVAWNGFLPSLSVDYFYGIDANHFAVNGIDPATGLPVRNLGYAATATLQLPIWNWGANRSQVKQADLRRQQARVELTFTQRQLLAKLQTLYNEAQTARAELESLNRSAELAAESLRLTTMRYQAGESTVLEVVDAQNTLTQERNAFNDGQVRFRVAMANLQTLTGAL